MTCAATGQTLEPGSECVSALVATDDEAHYQRLDFTAEAFVEPERCIGYWHRTVPPAAVKAQTLDVDQLFERFEQMAEEDAPHQAPLLYVMALWLMRRRRLRLDGSETTDSVDRLRLTGSGGEGPFAIRDQQLSADDARRLQAELFGEEEPAEVDVAEAA